MLDFYACGVLLNNLLIVGIDWSSRVVGMPKSSQMSERCEFIVRKFTYEIGWWLVIDLLPFDLADLSCHETPS